VSSSLKRAGAEKKLISQVLNHLQKKLYDGISTREIYREVYFLLNQLKHPLSLKYNLKEAIMALGPSGYPFEKFVAGVLARQGYQTKTNQIVKGRCVDHEIDVLAQKEKQSWLIECKFHNQPGTKSEIKEVLYTYARFLDVNQNGKFTQGWLITNTKVTSQVIKYAHCVNLMVLSWDYPKKHSLRLMIEIVFSHDLLTKEAPEKIKSPLLKKAAKQAKRLFAQFSSTI
jgi:hypothetical protein